MFALAMPGVIEWIIIVIVLAAWVIWIIALVDVVRRRFDEPNLKLIWVGVILLGHGVGGLIYLLIGRKQGVPLTTRRP